MNWETHAEELAEQITNQGSRWRAPVAATPRHLLVPRWWDWPGEGKCELRDGPADERAWIRAAYSDETLVTSVGGLHADHAQPGDVPSGLPTSSSTLPSLAVRMYRHAQLYDGAEVLDVGTGSGYGCALLCARLSDQQVTSIDVDSYLTEAAGERLDAIGLHPRLVTCNATGPLPGVYDRIVSMVSMPTVPPSWLAALRPGGRLVTVIAGTSVIITANKTRDEDGSVYAEGRVERDWAMFMRARSGPNYPPGLEDMFTVARDRDGEHVSQGRYPIVKVTDAWELMSVLEVTAPGIQHNYEESEDGRRTAWMVHRDGSWARATAIGYDPPIVHQGGPRRLWDLLDKLRDYWLRHGYFQLHGAKVFITPSGKIHLARGDWRATIA
ncbi:MAG: protein-L-isoaspartate(D-aspartate) O-methyltransferase [Streptosporangiales bacterium]|nr:protein-L-isoaspartate(D-aspartate) O-methyltransferase [Streptosporangiales bacterium]